MLVMLRFVFTKLAYGVIYGEANGLFIVRGLFSDIDQRFRHLNIEVGDGRVVIVLSGPKDNIANDDFVKELLKLFNRA